MKGINNIKRTIAPNQVFADVADLVDATISWKQGDLLWFDDVALLVKPITAEPQAQLGLGVALQSVTLGVVDGPYTGLTDTSPSGGAISGPQYGVEIEQVLQTGDTLTAGAQVYATAVNGVVSSAGTKSIGVYSGKGIVGAAAGTKITFHLGARYPTDSLKF